MHFTLLTLFEDMFPGPLGHSIAGKALEAGLWSYQTVNIRQFAEDKHGTVDDIPYGGGTGMVMRADVLDRAIKASVPAAAKLVYMSPRGKPFNQEMAYAWAEHKEVAILCGRYEGVDQRVLEAHQMEEVSMGDFILSGGEMAALTAMDACIRLIDGVIGKRSALLEESFGKNAEYTGLLEYPLYTRPAIWEHLPVPEVLLSGNHRNIEDWRLAQAQAITRERRPDLWEKYIKHTTDKRG